MVLDARMDVLLINAYEWKCSFSQIWRILATLATRILLVDAVGFEPTTSRV